MVRAGGTCTSSSFHVAQTMNRTAFPAVSPCFATHGWFLLFMDGVHAFSHVHRSLPGNRSPARMVWSSGWWSRRSEWMGWGWPLWPFEATPSAAAAGRRPGTCDHKHDLGPGTASSLPISLGGLKVWDLPAPRGSSRSLRFPFPDQTNGTGDRSVEDRGFRRTNR